MDDTILQLQNEGETFSIIQKYHELLTKANLEAAPDKIFLFPKKVKIPGTRHLIQKDTTNFQKASGLEESYITGMST